MIGPASEESGELKAGDTVTFNIGDGFPITCANCGKSSVKKSPKAKYCDEDCRYEAYNKKRRKAMDKLEKAA